MVRAVIPSPSQPLVGEDGYITQPWYDYLLSISGDIAGTPGEAPGGGPIPPAVFQQVESGISMLSALTESPAQTLSGVSDPDPLTDNAIAENLSREALSQIADRTLAGYGNIRQVADVALSDITSTWQTVPAALGSSGQDQRGVTAIPASDSLRFDTLGIWQLSITFTLGFTDINSGRTFQVRLYNITDTSASNATDIYIGRNQAGVNYAVMFLVTVDDSSVGDEFRVEIGNANTDITGVTLYNYSFDVVRVSEER